MTPVQLADVSHQACLLDTGISNVDSFLQPMSATISSGGWCGNYTRVFMRFAELEGYPAHKLHLQSGGRSHTLAEVYFEGKWRVVDPFFNLVYLLPDGGIATFQDLAETPALFAAPTRQPLDNPRLDGILEAYVPIFADLYSLFGDLSISNARYLQASSPFDPYFEISISV